MRSLDSCVEWEGDHLAYCTTSFLIVHASSYGTSDSEGSKYSLVICKIYTIVNLSISS